MRTIDALGRAAGRDVEQASLRIRLAATALAATVLVLLPGHDRVASGSLLLGYALAILALRAAGPTIPASGGVGVAIDVLFATGLSLLIRGETWVLYLVPIATAALRGGIHGLALVVAASVVALDMVLLYRGGSAIASDLWRIQAVLAFGVLAAELVLISARERRERRELRAYSLAQRDLAAATSEDALLERLVDHAVRGFGARAARIERDPPVGGRTTLARGSVDAADGTHFALAVTSDTRLHVVLAEGERLRTGAALRDLVADARPLLEAARRRVREQEERAAEAVVLEALARIGGETSTAAVIAESLTAVQQIGGPSALVRPATGESVAGDLESGVATAIARSGLAPLLLKDPVGPSGPGTGAIVPVAPGLVLVSVGARRDLTGTDLRLFTRLGQAAGAAIARIEERDALLRTEAKLRRQGDELERQLRARDDAVASAVHEIRNPLTSVRGYGQLMSRHLATVQEQVSQLDTLVGDLLEGVAGSMRRPLALETTDVAREAAGAVDRLRTAMPGTIVDLRVDDAELGAPLDIQRFAQVLDNVLRNAAKYSPLGTPITVAVTRHEDEVRVAVRDQGDGIAPGDLETIFDRYARGARHASTTPGAGIGLAVAREIVTAHGGRIWADSAGAGRGSTFVIALPAAVVATRQEAGSRA